MAVPIKGRWAIREIRRQVTSHKAGAFSRDDGYLDCFAPWLSDPITLVVMPEGEAGFFVNPDQLAEALQLELDAPDRVITIAIVSQNGEIWLAPPGHVRQATTDKGLLMLDPSPFPLLEEVIGKPRTRRTA